MSPARHRQFISFLKEELGVPVSAISLGQKQCASMPNYLPICLWQNGLITLDQVAQIFDWLEAA